MSEQTIAPAAPVTEARAPGGAVRRLTHEFVLAPLGGLLLAAGMTWPTLQHPASTIPSDIYDPLLETWQVAWAGHAVLHQPTEIFQANVFYPEVDTYAFTDTTFGYFPLSLFGDGPVAALVRYNIIYVLVAALAFVGAYALARQLGARWPGAIVAGAAFAYAPWRLAQAGHLHIISCGGIALALAALLRGHGYSFTGGYERDKARPGWAAFGWGVACWQLLIGFGVGLPFAYVLGLIGLVAGVGWLVAGRPALPKKLVLTDVGGAIAFAVAGALMAMPYLRVVAAHPYARRTELELNWFSPPLRGFLTAPAESWLWGDIQAASRAHLQFVAEQAMLPGIAVIVLAVIGLGLGPWRARPRIALGVATVVSLLFAMGTQFLGGRFTYLLLYRHLPGWDGIRTPGRLVIFTTLGLALLAACAVTGLVDALAKWRRSGQVAAVLATVAVLIPGAIVLVEGLNNTPHPEVPAEPAALHNLQGPAMVLPSDGLRDQAVMLWSTDGFPKVVNGGSGFAPHSTEEARAITASFPDAQSVDYLRKIGVRTVVLLPQRAFGTPWEKAAGKPVDGLPLTRTEVDGAFVYRINP